MRPLNLAIRRLLAGASITLVCALAAGQSLANGWRHHPGFHGGPGFHHFGHRTIVDIDIGLWQSGAWRHGWHNGRFAYWWAVGPYWYDYPRPVYPYPDYAPSVIVDHAPQINGQPPAPVWYYCESSKGYYPYVSNCSTAWRPVQATPPGVQ